jgi:hypothetical protein
MLATICVCGLSDVNWCPLLIILPTVVERTEATHRYGVRFDAAGGQPETLDKKGGKPWRAGAIARR